MAHGFLSLPNAPAVWLTRATLPAALVAGAQLTADAEGLADADILIEGATVSRIVPAGQAPVNGVPMVDLDHGMVWPCFVDMHTHLDKGHVWPRRPNPDGSFAGALEAVGADRVAHWTAEDVRRRMDFSLRCAYAHGTKLIRTHLDSLSPQYRISWPVFAAMRAAWAGLIDLQAASLIPIDLVVTDPGFFADLTRHVKAAGGVLGAVTFMVPEVLSGIDTMFATAAQAGLDLDFHVDESADPNARTLEMIADAALRHRFDGRIVVGHCCSLARQDDDAVDRTLDKVARAGIAVVSLPMCNLYLQDRFAGRTPRWRGVTLLHEMRARGIPVAVASDNTRDPFYAYGDLDVMEVFREAVRILHLDHPFGDWPTAVASSAADTLRRPDCGRIAVGGAADLVAFRARSWTELLSRPQTDRSVIRSGRIIDRTLPDYRELDDLLGAPRR